MLKSIFFFILTLHLFSTVNAIEHRKCRKIRSGFTCDTIKTDINVNLLEEPLLDNHIPETVCSVIPHPKVIINPYKNLKKDDILKPKNVTALCMRCGTCLAVADKLKTVINEIIEAEPTYDPIELAEILRNEAEIACENSFKNYDLRRYGNDIVVTNTFPDTFHLASELDFKWPIILKKTCQLYVEKIDFLKWFESYLLGTLDVTKELCRGEGLFRECKNVNYHYVVLDDGNDYLAMCTCSCSSKDHTY